MRTTLNIDDALLNQASTLTGIKQKTALVRLGLEALIARESSKRLAELEGTKKGLLPVPRRRPEDALYGKGKCGDEPAEGWAFGQGRLEKIRAAMAELEAEAQAEYATKQAAYEEKLKKRKHRKRPGKKPKPPFQRTRCKKTARLYRLGLPDYGFKWHLRASLQLPGCR